MYNSVGTYQLMKFLVIFVTCIMEFGFYRKTYSAKVYGVLAGLVFSVSLATITALNFSTAGSFFGIGGAVSTAYYQILNKFVQTEFAVQPLQLLHYEQPWSAAWCALFAALTEPIGNLLTLTYTTELACYILLSAVFAFGVNVTCYLIIGKTSPITYSVLGHLKTVSIFIVGAMFLGDNVRATQAFWMTAAFGCILLYGKVSAMPGASYTPPAAPSSNKNESVEIGALLEKPGPRLGPASPAAPTKEAPGAEEINLDGDDAEAAGKKE
jgi:solute carrier family 35 protein E3